MSRRGGRRTLKRLGSDQLGFAGSGARRGELEFTNAEQFDSIGTAQPLVLFYKDNNSDENPSIFDPELDEALLDLHESPFDESPLAAYEAYVTRASYECRLHPQQELLLSLVRDEVAGVDPQSILVMVYKRDSAARSIARNRRSNPFLNTVNGLVDTRPSPPLVLFTQHSLEPFCRAALVWHREPRANSTIGLIALQIIERI